MRKILADYIGDFKLVTRNIHLFIIGGLLVSLLQASMSLLMNLYLKEMGYGETFIGRVLSMSALGSVFSAIPAAYLGARYHIRPVLIISTILMAVSFFVMGHVESSVIIVSAGFCFGLFTMIRGVIAPPFIMRNSSERERMLVFAGNYSTWMIASMIGSYMAGWLHDYFRDYFFGQVAANLVEIYAYRYAMLVTTSIGLLAIIPFAMLRGKAPAPDEVQKAFSLQLLKANWRLLLKLNIPYILLGVGAGLIIPFLNLYFRDRFHLDTARIGEYFSILSVTMLVAVMTVPILKKHMGFIRTVALTELLSVPFMLALALTDNLAIAFWAFLFRGALMNMASPVSTSFMMEAVPEELHGIVNSFVSISWTAATALSTQIGGAIIESSGYDTSFYIAIALYIASAGSYFYYFSRCETVTPEKITIDVSAIR